MSVLHKPAMQGHGTATVTINGSTSPTPSPRSIDYNPTAIAATSRITTYELPSENSIPEEHCEDVSKITMQYYTTVEPPSVESSHDSTSTSSPGSDSVASGQAMHVTVLKSSVSSETSDPPNICVPASRSQNDSNCSGTVKHWSYEEQFKQVRNHCSCINIQQVFCFAMPAMISALAQLE